MSIWCWLAEINEEMKKNCSALILTYFLYISECLCGRKNRVKFKLVHISVDVLTFIILELVSLFTNA